MRNTECRIRNESSEKVSTTPLSSSSIPHSAFARPTRTSPVGTLERKTPGFLAIGEDQEARRHSQPSFAGLGIGIVVGGFEDLHGRAKGDDPLSVGDLFTGDRGDKVIALDRELVRTQQSFLVHAVGVA